MKTYDKAEIGKRTTWDSPNLKTRARVDRINIEGLVRTKDDYVVGFVRNLFKANDFQEVLIAAQRVREDLEALGCFQKVGIFIDESKGPKATPHGLEVTFEVQEGSRVVGGVDTVIGSNEGGVSIGLQMPNTFGRGEKFFTEYKYGAKKTSSMNFTFKKPHRGALFANLTGSVSQGSHESPESGYKQVDKSILLDCTCATLYMMPLKHSFQWEGSWRELACLKTAVADAVREEAGHSLKSSLRYIMSWDTRISPAFPSRGCLLQLTNELAGLGGDTKFRKHEVKCEANITVLPSMVVQATLQGGQITSDDSFLKASICDKFFLGGPLSVRGFRSRGIGLIEHDCALGGTAYWAAGLHLFSPLPLIPRKQSWADLFRVHLFVNAGCLNHSDAGRTAALWKTLCSEIRVACGAGLAVRVGNIARAELNYCIPLRYSQTDCIEPGFRFGIGLEFL